MLGCSVSPPVALILGAALVVQGASGCAAVYTDGHILREDELTVVENPDLQRFEVTWTNKVGRPMCVSVDQLPSKEGALDSRGEPPFDPFVVEGDRIYRSVPYTLPHCIGCSVRLRTGESWRGYVAANGFKGLDLSKPTELRRLHMNILAFPC